MEANELEAFLVNFIVEQTGYPPESVDIDADLEADLGIDSIKKAQMFGELGERFQIAPPSGNITLDDFQTLRHVLEFLSAAPSPPVSAPVKTGTAVEAPASRREATSLERDRMMSRFVMRLVPQALTAAKEKFVWGRRALVVGANADGRAIASKLRGMGIDAQLIDAGSDPVAAAAMVDRAWNEAPFEHVFLTTPRDGAGASYRDAAGWKARRDAGLLVPFAVCQKWYERISATKGTIQPTLAAATALGGDFGQRGEIDAVESGGICGLLKGIFVESNGQVKVRVIDVARNYPPQTLADNAVAELESPDIDVEVCYDPQRGRRVVRSKRQPASTLAPRSIPQGSTWVVTGGARGITAYVARELGQRFGLRLHLIGSSPAPEIDPGWRNLSPEGLKQLKTQQIAPRAIQQGVSPAEAWLQVERALELDRNLRDFAARGIRASYHTCDIADRARIGPALGDDSPDRRPDLRRDSWRGR